ncbi:MAG: PEP-CTERM sorting domain-containing protein [Planctomycetales bacterium]|nr:PEP-CTERM sorting domain-containing protein [Planctomycetales bacterium]
MQGGGVQTYAGAVVNVSAGTIGFGSTVYREGRLNLSGGSLGTLEVLAGGAASISGGELLGSNFDAALFGDAGAEIVLHGGEIQGRFQLFGTNLDPTFAYVTGGSFESEVWVQGESELELVGTEFAIDGVPLADLDLGSPSLVDQRNVQLTGLLLDGSPFSFDLNEVLAFGEDWFPAQAALKLTLVFPGDFDFDGTIALSDFSLLKENFGAAGGPADGDANGDGRVDLADFSILKSRFGQTASVPEPASWALAAVGAIALMAAARPRCGERRHAPA